LKSLEFLRSDSAFHINRSFSYREIASIFDKTKYDCLPVIDELKGTYDGIIHRDDFIGGLIRVANHDETVASDVIQTTDASVEVDTNELTWLRFALTEAKKFTHSYIPVRNRKSEFLGFVYKPNAMEIKGLVSKFKPKVAVVGLGYVGLTLAIVLAQSGFKILGIEADREKLKLLKQGRVPFFEKNMQDQFAELVKQQMIRFADVEDEFETNFAIITVGTPLGNDKITPRISYLDEAIESVKTKLLPGGIIVLRSTVPLGTTNQIRLNLFDDHEHFQLDMARHIVFAPERTLEGDALNELRQNPQIIGAQSGLAASIANQVFSSYANETIILSSYEEAELVKLTDNTSRDLGFAFANALACISLTYGIDTNSVIKAANQNYKRTNVPLPSPGVGGPCLTKDPHLLNYGLPDLDQTVKTFFTSGRKLSTTIISEINKKISHHYSALGVNKILFFGLAFKGYPETSDTRDSTSIELIRQLSEWCPSIYIWDPIVIDYSDVGLFPNIKILTNFDFDREEDERVLIVLANNSQHFSKLNWDFLFSTKRKFTVVDLWGAVEKLFDSFDIPSESQYLRLGRNL